MKTILIVLMICGCDLPTSSYYSSAITCDPTLVCIPAPDSGSFNDGEIEACPCGYIATSTTVQVPLFSTVNDAVFPGRFIPTNGPQGIEFQIPLIPIGAIITNLSVRVKDNSIGPTKLFLSIADQIDNTLTLGSLLSSSTNGGGTFQTLSLNNISIVVITGHTYYGGVFVSIPGTAPCGLFNAEVTYVK